MGPAGRRRPVRRRLTIWLFGSLVGGLVLGLPDNDARLVSFSPQHGLSTVDLIGIAILVAAWLPILLYMWKGRAELHGPWAMVVAILAVAGVLLLVGAIAADMTSGWLIGAILLILAQLLAVATINSARVRR